MKTVAVVGSGPSGVHLSLSLLRKGYAVELFDVGNAPQPPVRPEATFRGLKTSLDDPVEYFLGKDFDSVLFPGDASEYYGFPPSKQYVFTSPFQDSPSVDRGFAPLYSFARGGLAEAWTGGCYPLSDDDLTDFPIDRQSLRAGYDEVARRIGVNGAVDDLGRFIPGHEGLLEPLTLDPHSAALMDRYSRRRDYFHRRLRCYLGRSRVATLTQDRGDRSGCKYLGRCLWGCPAGSLYTPSHTLAECRRHPAFRYVSGVHVRHFQTDASRQATAIVAEDLSTRTLREFRVDSLVLAAGALSSSRIFLESIRRRTGEVATLTGLMDNRQVMVPFITWRMIGQPTRDANYQYHLLALGLEGAEPRAFIHSQITTLKTALVHPLIQQTPLPLRASLQAFRNLRGALGLVNVNFHDTRRSENSLTLSAVDTSEPARLRIDYSPPSDEPQMIARTLRRLRKALWKLGCIAPPGMTHVRPMGASVHYAGTIPMSRSARPLTSSPDGRSHDFPNVYFADAATFPFLPAKNLTFTLMANAVRIANAAF